VARNKFLAGRVRSAILVALTNANAPMGLAEIARAVEAMGIPLGARANKTVSDALRWEVGRGRALRWGRGTYRIGTVPRTTLYYMRKRVQAYAAGETTPADARERRHLSELGRASRTIANDEVALLIDSARRADAYAGGWPFFLRFSIRPS
jgi:hypothetical protein